MKKTGELIKTNKNIIIYTGGLFLVVKGCLNQGYEKGFQKGVTVTCDELEEFKPGIMTELFDHITNREKK